MNGPLEVSMTVVLRPPQETATAAPAHGRTVDQTLCAAAYLCEGFAEYVHWFLSGRPGEAWAPCWGVDTVALLRHANLVRHVRGLRDAGLSLLTVAVVAVIVAQIAGSFGVVPSAVTAVAMIVGWACHRHFHRLLQGVWAKVWMGGWKDRLRRARRALALVAAIVFALVLAVPPVLIWVCLSTVFVMMVLAWLVAVAELLWAQGRAGAVLASGVEPCDLVRRRLTPSLEARAASMTSMNVLVYSPERASMPFVGNGFQVRPWRLDVNVQKGATGSTGREEAPKDVDVVELHEFLEQRFSIEVAVEGTASRRLSTGHRLYVDGARMPWGSTLLVGDPPLPSSRVEWQDLVPEIGQSHDVGHQRIYFYLQEIGRQGQIVVAVFVRAYLHGAHLAIEVVPHMLLPIRSDIEAVVTALPKHRLDRLAMAVRGATSNLPALVLDSADRCIRAVRGRRQTRLSQRRLRRAARRRRPHDFGAVISIREGVMEADATRLEHFVVADLARINANLIGRIMACVKKFLDERGVNTEALENSTRRTVNHIQNWNVSNFKAETLGIGNKHVFESQQRDHGDDSGKETA
jgi:hypothetical protein